MTARGRLSVVKMRRVAAGLALIVVSAGCGSSDASGGDAAPASASVAPTIDAPESSTSAPAAPDDGGDVRPLYRQAPVLNLSVDGVSLVELSLGFEQWNDETIEPAEPEPDAGIVVAAGSDLTLEGPHRADGTVTLFRLDQSLRFVQGATVGWSGTEVTMPSPGVGTWFLDARALFGPSTEYEGNGILRAGAWLQVTPTDAPCDAPSVSPAFGPGSQVTGVVDRDGCPVAAAEGRLELAALTPWFHCAPWPPVIEWGPGQDGSTRQFWQYVNSSSEIVETSAPVDATATGRFIGAGEILTSDSNPDAIYVQTPNGSVQRWTTPAEELGCA